MPDGVAPEGSTQRGWSGMRFLLANKTAWPILRRAVRIWGLAGRHRERLPQRLGV